MRTGRDRLQRHPKKESEGRLRADLLLDSFLCTLEAKNDKVTVTERRREGEGKHYQQDNIGDNMLPCPHTELDFNPACTGKLTICLSFCDSPFPVTSQHPLGILTRTRHGTERQARSVSDKSKLKQKEKAGTRRKQVVMVRSAVVHSWSN